MSFFDETLTFTSTIKERLNVNEFSKNRAKVHTVLVVAIFHVQ